MRSSIDGFEIAPHAQRIFLERVHIREDEADWVVQLVRHARDQPAERRHLLGEDEVLLRLLQLAMRLIEALIGAAQFAKRQAHHHAAGVTPLMVEPRGAVHREGGGRAARIPQANLAIGNSAIHAQLCQHLLDVPSAAGVENRGEAAGRPAPLRRGP